MKTFLILILVTVIASNSFAQKKNTDSFKPENLNWYNKDIQTNKILGTSVDKSYNSLLNGMQPKKTIVVAVIDGGVDINHQDLQGKIWVNSKEIPGNGIDDDNNGYIDDIHGWNFLGNKKGENITYENYEYTRLLKEQNSVSYAKAKSFYDKELSKRQTDQTNLVRFEAIFYSAKSIIKDFNGTDAKSKEDLAKIKSSDPKVNAAKDFLLERFKMGFTEESLIQYKKMTDEYINYYLNTNLNPRTIIGDDPENMNDKDYGNNDVTGPRADHGTGVAGIIAANRNNNLGIDGIASQVKIMAVRTTPSGDERDKDVALGIIYAVDNGADIINMSFGKPLSPQKKFVDEAVKYAEAHGVLLVHAAGNSGENIDTTGNFPTNIYLDGNKATNWITIGATEMTPDKGLPAAFSNYGSLNVDVFAPGVDIVSLDTSSTYEMHSGTSFSAPVVSGIAALLLSYYPQLTPQQLIEILKESSYKVTKPRKVLVPSLTLKKRVKGRFSELSQSGGVVNAYEALLLAKKKYE